MRFLKGAEKTNRFAYCPRTLKHMEGLDNKPLALENPESPKL